MAGEGVQLLRELLRDRLQHVVASVLARSQGEQDLPGLTTECGTPSHDATMKSFPRDTCETWCNVPPVLGEPLAGGADPGTIDPVSRHPLLDHHEGFAAAYPVHGVDGGLLENLLRLEGHDGRWG
jgi:hypothetical protein